MIFFLGRMYFAGDDGYQNFLGLTRMLHSPTMDNNKTVTNWILIGKIFQEKSKSLDSSLASIMSNLTNGGLSINSVLVQKFFSSLYSNFILYSYLVYKLNNWPNNPSNDFTLKNFLWSIVKLKNHSGDCYWWSCSMELWEWFRLKC